MKRALYLRPNNLGLTGLDDAVKAWLRSADIEPVEDGQYDLVVYLPYDGGGNYYHADVSPEMAAVLVAHIADGMEVRGIELRGTETCWAGEVDRENDYKELESADLAWDDTHHGGNPTISIMTPAQVEEAEAVISVDKRLGWNDLGVVWSPPQPEPARAPQMPFLRASVGKVTYGFTKARGESVPITGGPLTRLIKGLFDEQTMDIEYASRGPGDKLPILQERSAQMSPYGQSLMRCWVEEAVASGELQMPEGMTVDQFIGGMTVVPAGDAFLGPNQDVEETTHSAEVTFHPDGSYSKRLR